MEHVYWPMTFRSKTMKEVKIDQVLNEEAKNGNSQQEESG